MKIPYFIKRLFYIAVLNFFFPIHNNLVQAQQASGIPYSVNVFSAAVPAFPAGATNIVIDTADRDEGTILITPSPSWSFDFAGHTYTKMVVSTNGWMALMPNSIVNIPPPFNTNAFPDNRLDSNTTGFPIIAPLWDDLSMLVCSWVELSNEIWIRWSVKWQSTHNVAASLWYVKLNSTDNSITFYYANNPSYSPINPSASAGIAGICTGDFYSLSFTSNSSGLVDSVVENRNLGNNLPPDLRPFNCIVEFNPVNFEDNCSGNFPARDLGQVSLNCIPFTASTIHSGNSGIGNCSTNDVNDVWFKVFKPASVSQVYIATSPAECESVSGTSIEVYDSCGGPMRNCSITGTLFPSFAELTFSSGNPLNLYVRITSDGDTAGKFKLCIRDNSGTTGIQEQNQSQNNILHSYTNARGNLVIRFDVADPGRRKILVSTLLGQSLLEREIDAHAGNNSVELPSPGKGIYIITLFSEFSGSSSIKTFVE